VSHLFVPGPLTHLLGSDPSGLNHCNPNPFSVSVPFGIFLLPVTMPPKAPNPSCSALGGAIFEPTEHSFLPLCYLGFQCSVLNHLRPSVPSSDDHLCCSWLSPSLHSSVIFPPLNTPLLTVLVGESSERLQRVGKPEGGRSQRNWRMKTGGTL